MSWIATRLRSASRPAWPSCSGWTMRCFSRRARRRIRRASRCSRAPVPSCWSSRTPTWCIMSLRGSRPTGACRSGRSPRPTGSSRAPCCAAHSAARLRNAATALGVPVARLASRAATVMVSFSKGLGCPVGSCLAFRAAERPRAWEIRKRLGGGMRQSGILAAAALWALDHNLARLQDDHLHARLLADLLADCAALRPVPPESNIVMVDLVRERDTAEAVASKLAQAGLLVVPFGARRLRAVTHLDVGREDIERAAQIVARALA